MVSTCTFFLCCLQTSEEFTSRYYETLYIHTFVQSRYICTCLGITCTPDLLESMCPPRGVSCPSTHHIHRQSMSIPKNVSVSQYGGNVNNTIRTFLEQKPTLCVWHIVICTEYICTVSLGITCTPDLLESMCPPRGVSCPSTHHIHRQSMSIPKNVSVSQYGGNVNNTIRTFLEQKPTLCVWHIVICTEYICTVSLGITCTPDLLESMCPPRGVSCPSTHHIHRQSMSIPKNVSVSQYGGNVNNTIRTFLEQKPTLCVCLLGEYTMAHCTYMCTFVGCCSLDTHLGPGLWLPIWYKFYCLRLFVAVY